MGTKVKCIDAHMSGGGLTRGCVYTVLTEKDDFYRIADNSGCVGGWSKYRFEVLNETPATPPETSAFTAQIGGSHYKDMAIQPLEYIMANGIPFAEGNVIKYLSRWRKKNGLQDLEKGLDMMTKIVEQVRNGTYA